MKIVFLVLCCGLFPVNAIAVTWSGLGADNLASTPDNWIGAVSPQAKISTSLRFMASF